MKDKEICVGENLNNYRYAILYKSGLAAQGKGCDAAYKDKNSTL